MNYSESVLFTREIASRVAASALYAEYPEALHGEAAVRNVIGQFSDALLLEERAGKDYIDLLCRNARELDPWELRNDPYLQTVKIRECRCGDFLLTNSTYERGELLQYAMPDLSAKTVTARLGFYPERVEFPAIYEGNIPWVSVCPSEISSMRRPIEQARGRVLTLGCGLGYYPFMVSGKAEVERVTIVERQREVIELFSKQILPYFPHPEKVEIIRADAFDYVRNMPENQYDECFADIWEGPEDGANAYIQLKEYAEQCRGVRFTYWIEEEIRWWLVNKYA